MILNVTRCNKCCYPSCKSMAIIWYLDESDGEWDEDGNISTWAYCSTHGRSFKPNTFTHKFESKRALLKFKKEQDVLEAEKLLFGE